MSETPPLVPKVSFELMRPPHASSAFVVETYLHARGKVVAGFTSSLVDQRKTLRTGLRQRLSKEFMSVEDFVQATQKVAEVLVEDSQAEFFALWAKGQTLHMVLWRAHLWCKRNGEVFQVGQAVDRLEILEVELQPGDLYLCVSSSAQAVVYQQLQAMMLTLDATQLVGQLQQKCNESALRDKAVGATLLVGALAPDTAVSSKLPSPRALQHLHPRKLFKRDSPALRIVLAMVILGMVVGASLGGWRTWQVIERSRASQAFAPYFAQLQALEQLPTVTIDELQVARQEMQALEREVQELRGSLPKRAAWTRQANDLGNRIEVLRKKLSGQREVSVLPVFYDLQKARADFLTSGVVASSKISVFLDTQNQTFLKVDLMTKGIEQLPVGTLPPIQAIALVDNTLYILAQGIYRFEIGASTLAEKSIELPEELLAAESLAIFGDVGYVFDRAQREVFRFALSEPLIESAPVDPVDPDDAADPTASASAEVAQPRFSPWFRSKQGVDFAQVVSVVVDGGLWLSDQQGGVFKFELGEPQEFSIQNLSDPFASSVHLYTREDLEFLYLLQPDAQRVVVVDKTGQYYQQISHPLLKTVSSFFIDADTGSVFFVSGSVVYSVPLKF